MNRARRLIVQTDLYDAHQRESQCVLKPIYAAPMRGRLSSIGVDLRLMEADDFRRTELIKQPEHVEARASEWKTALLEKAWE